MDHQGQRSFSQSVRLRIGDKELTFNIEDMIVSFLLAWHLTRLIGIGGGGGGEIFFWHLQDHLLAMC